MIREMVAVGLCALLGAAACGAPTPQNWAGDAAPLTMSRTSVTGTAGTPPGQAPTPMCTADDVSVSGNLAEKPRITVPGGCTRPTRLHARDIAAGDGSVVRVGATVVVDYVLVTWSDGKERDSTWTPVSRQPLTVENIGHAIVIDGWNEGLISAREGTRRLLIVPPDKGYGINGNGPIAPNETLVFVVDIKNVTYPR